MSGCVKIWRKSPRISGASACTDVEPTCGVHVSCRGSVRELAFEFEGRVSGPPSRFERLTN